MNDTVRGLQPLRLNPFIFPSNTSLRFILLILIATCAGGRRCAEMTFAGFDLGPQLKRCLGDTTNYSDRFARTDAGLARTRFECISTIMQASVLPGILAGLSLLLLFTAIIYRLYPRWQARQLGLERLDATQLPDLVHEFHKLCMAAQLRRRPELWWNPLDGRMLAIAFGTGSRPASA